MSSENQTSLEDLFSLFDGKVSAADVIEAKLDAQITKIIIGERLRRKMSQADFAKFLGVSQSTVSKWEGGEYNFTIRKIAEIAGKLDLDLNIISVDSSELEDGGAAPNVISFPGAWHYGSISEEELKEE